MHLKIDMPHDIEYSHFLIAVPLQLTGSITIELQSLTDSRDVRVVVHDTDSRVVRLTTTHAVKCVLVPFASLKQTSNARRSGRIRCARFELIIKLHFFGDPSKDFHSFLSIDRQALIFPWKLMKNASATLEAKLPGLGVRTNGRQEFPPYIPLLLLGVK